jgi:hypothetical protein
MTPHEFVESSPLYTRVELKDFTPPGSITRMCYQCGKETTWLKSQDPARTNLVTFPRINFDAVGYSCGLCSKDSFAVVYQNLDLKEDPNSHFAPKHWQHTAVHKIGQVPPQSIQIPTELSKRLGSSAGHYKKALVSRSQGYGIGAMAYLRRVVDEKTDELIDVMVDLAQTYNVGEKEIASLLGTKREVRYEDKLKVASDLVPEALKPVGVNPLGQLYKHTSVGLHGKTDDECIAMFDDLKADFEYIFRNLHLQAKERREFSQRVQERARKTP